MRRFVSCDVTIRFFIVIGWFFCITYFQPLAAQWSLDRAVNNAICTAPQGQNIPVIVGDGTGGAIIAWYDYRSGLNYDVYAQRVSASGRALWTFNGVPISTAPNSQASVVMIGDGVDGAILAWEDTRVNTDTAKIFAQRIDRNGTAMWTTNGIPICTGSGYQRRPRIVSDGSGGVIITWYDLRKPVIDDIFDYDIYAQRVNASGTVMWGTGGTVISSATGNQEYAEIVSDGSGGAIITWWDFRNPATDVYAQRVDASGVVRWAPDGVVISAATNDQSLPTIVSDNAGGAIIAWQDYRSGTNDIYAQRIDGAGSVKWTTNGVLLCNETDQQGSVDAVADGAGGAIVLWVDNRTDAYGDLYVQRIDSSGAVQWTPNGVPVAVGPSFQNLPVMSSDPQGGVLITWLDQRTGVYDIYAQKLNSSGEAQWTPNGHPICTAPSDQYEPFVVSDAGGGAVFAWPDNRDGNIDIYAQRVDMFGNPYPAPQIADVRDVANDQGGKIRVFWDRSPLDVWPNSMVRYYNVWLGVSPSGASGELAPGNAVPDGINSVAASSSSPAIYWEYAGSVNARWFSGYSMVVGTQADSSLQGVTRYYIQVTAQSVDSTIFWASNIDSGYSVDNLPPLVPSSPGIAPLSGGPIQLHWQPNRSDPDVAGYSVYRSTLNSFPVIPANRLVMISDTVYVDSTVTQGQTYYYRITTFDVHGNESSPTAELSAMVTDVNDPTELPTKLALRQNYPNPFNPGTTIAFDLPEAGHVTLRLYDALGRLVKNLVDETKEPGHYRINFDAGTLPSGVYYYRLVAGQSVQTRKLMLVR